MDLSNIIISETNPTVPTHVKQIPQDSTNEQVLQWNGTTWETVTPPPPAAGVLLTTGVTAGTYTSITSLTVDEFGQITNVIGLLPPTEQESPLPVPQQS